MFASLGLAHVRSFARATDNVAPTVELLELADGQAVLSHLSPLVFNATFSKPVAGVSASLFRCVRRFALQPSMAVLCRFARASLVPARVLRWCH